ncbi:transglycosylase domain-containing protein [uncultured Alistipes sp.]|uniref:transglycosylase domain-containing protein n=1 Tax=uncultured Alistipes sp. TaxID=538949 RepID=UPI002593ACBE|nr:transglycosylase domain-containing protein [uncultured Alistipes sp.]
MDKKKILERLQAPKAVRWFWIILCAPVALILLLLLLTRLGAFGKLPTFEELENPKSNLATEIYSDDGEMIGSFFIQNRSYVDYNELSPALVAALISTEDMRFYSHSGIDFISLARVAVKTLALGNRRQGGGSTITQQLAKNLYPRDTAVYNNPISKGSKLVISKLKEWITAVMLEYNYTKEEIITMYLNTVPYGSNAYGIKSAARTFFNKLPSELNVQEAAMLVGVVNAPTRYSPRSNPDRALARRNTVISRMREKGYLTRAQRDSIQALPIELDFRPISHNAGTGTYFREMLRMVMTSGKPSRESFGPGAAGDWDYRQAVEQWESNPLYGWCDKNVKANGQPYDLYRDGLKIYTTVNATMQRYAEQAVWEQMGETVQPMMDRVTKARGSVFSDISKDEREAIMRRAKKNSDRYRQMKRAGATDAEIDKAFATPVPMRVFSYKGDRDTVMSPDDSLMYYKKFLRASFMAVDPSNGYVKAYVGGTSYRYFKYDMAKQGRRQVGSTIKPFVYTFAIEQLDLTPCTQVPNLPVTIETDNEPWSPREASKVVYDGEWKPLRWGLANSRNNYSAWIMKQARQPQAVADFIHKFGIRSYIDPVYALCLGTSDFSLFELVGAYGTFANRGVHVDPIFVTRIEDRHGNVLANFTSPSQDAISEQSAYTMLGMLKRVVNAGTAGRIRALGLKADMGGKTGTSQKNSDAWFVGVTPKLVAGAWVGGEDRSIHLSSGGEGSRIALPIFANFMKKVYGDSKLGITEKDQFPIPVNAVSYDCDESAEPAAALPSSGGGDEFFD